jgi:flavin-dependent dehydrogenase
MPATERTGVCIVGAGPAGSSLAIRIAQLGHEVCLIERERFPRRHLGESLSPGVWPQFDLLGVRPAVATSGFRLCRHAFVSWQHDAVERRDFDDRPGLIVDRGAFDALLLERARAYGVRVLQPAVLRRRRRYERGWQLQVTIGDRAINLEARFLADASGRAVALRGDRRLEGMRTLALYAYWRAQPLPGAPHIEAGESGWCWGVPLPDGTYNAIAFIDPEELRREQGSALYERLILGSGLLAACSERRPISRVRATDATAYLTGASIELDCIRVGEAALAIDPLSSSGVEKSLQTGLAGAIAVNTLLRRPHLAEATRQFYRQSLEEASDRHRRWAAAFYRAAAARRRDRFWQSRAIEGEAMPEPAARLPQPAWEQPIALSPLAELVKLPGVVGDFVAINQALRHPALERPVAFLSGIAIASLLQPVRTGMTLAELAGSWCMMLPPSKATAIARFLYGHYVLVPATNLEVLTILTLRPPT